MDSDMDAQRVSTRGFKCSGRVPFESVVGIDGRGLIHKLKPSDMRLDHRLAASGFF